MVYVLSGIWNGFVTIIFLTLTKASVRTHLCLSILIEYVISIKRHDEYYHVFGMLVWNRGSVDHIIDALGECLARRNIGR